MTYFLIFDNEENFLSYTKKPDDIVDFIHQRYPHDYIISKVGDDFFSKRARKHLKYSGVELENYYNVLLLPEESYGVTNTTMKKISRIYDTIEGVLDLTQFVNFSEEEKDVVWPFLQSMYDIKEKLEEGFFQVDRQDEYDECLRTKRLVLDTLLEGEGDQGEIYYLH